MRLVGRPSGNRTDDGDGDCESGADDVAPVVAASVAVVVVDDDDHNEDHDDGCLNRLCYLSRHLRQ